MPLPQVQLEDIDGLDSTQLQTLLGKLLHLEARSHGIARSIISAPDSAQITIPDGGLDASIHWHNGPTRTDWLCSQHCGFQSKATPMPPGKCESEVVGGPKSRVSPEIEALLRAGGTYIIFCKQGLNKKSQFDNRIDSIRKGLRTGGYVDANKASLDFYDGNKIRNWVNCYPSTINWVLSARGKRPWTGVQAYASWAKNDDIYKFSFVVNERIKNQIRSLQSLILEPRSTVRLTGLPGLGKTRLAFEALSPNVSNSSQTALSDSVMYVQSVGKETEIIEIAETLRDAQSWAVLVIDDCSPQLHGRIASIAKNRDSRFSLLTLDFEPEHAAIGGNSVAMDTAETEIIEGMIRQTYPTIPKDDIQRIVEFASGFPQMADLLAQAQIAGRDDLHNLFRPEVYEKLIWGRETNQNRKHLTVLQTCSIFKTLGTDDALRTELEFAASLTNLTVDEFEEGINYFLSRKRIQKAGRYIGVSPPPLALRLAADWWQQAPTSRWQRLFGGGVPKGLIDALCSQLRLLDFIHEARTKVAALCGEHAPFGSAEALNTEQGSLCFRSMVEVNPEATAMALERAFADWPVNQLRAVGPGRRNLVWALEKLVFRQTTFESAARVLLAFAAAENENWGNNATGQFKQLYQLHLGGTETPAIARLSVIDDAINSNVREKQRVAVVALEHALNTHNFTRTGGAERQGSGPALTDWRPKNWGEIRDYYRAVLERLKLLALSDDLKISGSAQRAIGDHIRDLARLGLIEEIQSVVQDIAKLQPEFWKSALIGVSSALHYDFSRDDIRTQIERAPFRQKAKTRNYLTQVRKKLIGLFNHLYPSTPTEQFTLLMRENSREIFYDKSDHQDQGAQAVKATQSLAKQFASTPVLIKESLIEFVSGTQTLGFPFGSQLGQSVRSPKSVLKKLLDAFIDLSAQQRNPTIIRGFIEGLANRTPEMVAEFLEQVSKKHQTLPYLVSFTTAKTITARDIKRIVDVLNEGSLDPECVRELAWGSVLSGVPQSTVGELIDALLDQDKKYYWIALEIIVMYSLGTGENFQYLKERAKRIILTPGLLATRANRKTGSQLDEHSFETVAKKLIDETGDESIAMHLAKELIDLAKRDRFPYRLNHVIEELLTSILKKFPGSVWPVLGHEIISANKVDEFHLEVLLGGGTRDAAKALALVPEDDLIGWARQTKPDGPAFLAKIAPLLHSQDKDSWSPLIIRLLDEFGDIKDITSCLSVNIGTFGHSGPIYTYYEQFIVPLTNLSNHRALNVRKWAHSELAYLLNEIRKEKLHEEEERFRTA